jgi:hypothetical protein
MQDHVLRKTITIVQEAGWAPEALRNPLQREEWYLTHIF